MDWLRNLRPHPVDAEALCNMAIMASNEKKAAILMRESAEMGFAPAQRNLAWRYSIGRGVAQDDRQAAVWYERAAMQGLDDAQYALGAIYSAGRGVSKDGAKSIAWFRKAAERGNSDARRALGDLYATGRGVEKNMTEAVMYYAKSYSDKAKRARLAIYLSGEVMPDRYSEIMGLKDAEAIYKIAMAYREGLHRDEVLAAFWIRKAAELGFAEAQYQQARLYNSGIDGKDDGRGLVPLNRAEQKFWYEKAAEQGHVHAAYVCGCICGDDVSPDLVNAYKWYHIAATRPDGGQLSINSGGDRDEVAKKMTNSQIAEALRRFDLWEQRQSSGR